VQNQGSNFSKEESEMSRARKLLALCLGLSMLLALVPAALAQGVTVQVSDHPELGKILTDANGRTLYLFTKDGENVSNCYDQCAVNWPPLLVGAGEEPAAGPGLPGQLGTITRTDGGRQVTYNGMPLYYWAADSNPGDASGQGVGDVWFVVHPDISSMTVNSPVVQVTANSALGDLLTSQGMTLYLYTKDGENVSNCYDQCAANWPPLLVGNGALVAGAGLTGTLGVIDRTDGGRQVTYNGIPLYFWIRDVRPGDTNGQGVGGVWFVVGPQMTAATVAQTAAQAATATPAAPAATAAPTATTAAPAALPQTGGGGGLPSWAIVLIALGGGALLLGGVGLAVSRRAR
jgi:predicted lipoprotein with Yx(FWY)xxD motif